MSRCPYMYKAQIVAALRECMLHAPKCPLKVLHTPKKILAPPLGARDALLKYSTLYAFCSIALYIALAHAESLFICTVVSMYFLLYTFSHKLFYILQRYVTIRRQNKLQVLSMLIPNKILIIFLLGNLQSLILISHSHGLGLGLNLDFGLHI